MRGRGRRDPRRPQPVPARHRHPRAAARDRRAPAALLRARLRRRHRGARHRGRDRGDRRGAARAVRARRRGRDVRAVLRLVRGVHRDGGRDTGASCTLRPPDYVVRPRRAARAAITPRTQLLLLNSPHNPTGKVFTRASSSSIAAAVRRARPARRHRRGLRAPRVRRASTSRWRRCPGMRERTVTISSGGKTFSFTGWKVGWVCAPPDARRRGPDGEAVPHLRERRAVPDGDRGRARAARRRRSAGSPPTLREKRDRLSRRARGRRASTCCRPQGTYFVTTDIRSLGETDGLAFCRSLPRALRRGRGAERRVLRRRGRRPAARAVRVLQAARGDRRGVRRRLAGDWPDEGRRASSTTSCGRTATRTSRASRR